MTTQYPTLCRSCVRRVDAVTCLSFPSGIPDEIVRYGADHRESIGLEMPYQLDPTKQYLLDEWLTFSPYAKGGTQ
jgi:hypothetical protein